MPEKNEPGYAKQVYYPKHWKEEFKSSSLTLGNRLKAKDDEKIFNHKAWAENHPFNYIEGKDIDELPDVKDDLYWLIMKMENQNKTFNNYNKNDDDNND